MSIVVRFQPAALTTEQYDESIKRLEEAGEFPPDGLEYHICFGPDGNMKVSEIWDSREQLESFGQRLVCPSWPTSGSSSRASRRSSRFTTSSGARQASALARASARRRSPVPRAGRDDRE